MVVFIENNIALRLKANETMNKRVADHTYDFFDKSVFVLFILNLVLGSVIII